MWLRSGSAQGGELLPGELASSPTTAWGLPMRLDIRCFALAAGVSAALAFTLCALAVAVAPGATAAFLSFVAHYDLTDRARVLTPGNFVGGLVAWSLGAAALAALLGWVYNQSVSRRKVVVAALFTARHG